VNESESRMDDTLILTLANFVLPVYFRHGEIANNEVVGSSEEAGWTRRNCDSHELLTVMKACIETHLGCLEKPWRDLGNQIDRPCWQ
jgi:hypothetical protein